MTPIHQLMSYQLKSYVFVRNKSIIKMLLTLNHCFLLKYESSNHNVFSNEKVKSSESGEKYAQIKPLLQDKTA